MTLQSSGAISLGNVNTENGLSATATISMNDTASRNLAGVASGAISMSNFYGKSGSATFVVSDYQSFSAGVYYDDNSDADGSAQMTITASASVVWTFTKGGTNPAVLSSNGFVSGSAATSVTFSLAAATTSVNRSATATVTAGGNTWNLSFTAFGLASGNCVVITSLLLMADGSFKPAGDIKVGDWLWTQHEQTRKWGAYCVSAISFHDEDVYSIPGHPLATYAHRFALPFKGWWRAGWFGRKVGRGTVAKITVAEAHTYMAKRPGSKWLRLCHNQKA